MSSLPNVSVERLEKAFRAGKTLPYEFRLDQLCGLVEFLCGNKAELVQALQADFKCKAAAEFEHAMVLSTATTTIDKLRGWMEPVPVPVSRMAFRMDSCYIKWEPKGVVLIMGAWNFPLELTLHPLIEAIAAGCCAVAKPSEVAMHTANLMAERLPRYLDPDCFGVVAGGPQEAGWLLDLKWDLIFFTGGEKAGRIVAEKAAKHLTPVVLELGGKSPCIVTAGVDIATAAKRIVAGKLDNAGQICIAPDYVLCEALIVDQLVAQIVLAIKAFYGDNPQVSPDYTRIVNEHHWDRLSGLMKDPEKGRVLFDSGSDRQSRYFGPVVLLDPLPNAKVMQEEIFGPILPIVRVASVDEAIDYVNARPKPLTIYLFASHRRYIDQVQLRTSSGSFVVNDTVVHYMIEDLPFGGVGSSGMGAYHGKRGFETFSHGKAVLWRSLYLEWINDAARYPPLTEKKAARSKAALFATPSSRHYRKHEAGSNLRTVSCILASLGIAAALAIAYVRIHSF